MSERETSRPTLEAPAWNSLKARNTPQPQTVTNNLPIYMCSVTLKHQAKLIDYRGLRRLQTSLLARDLNFSGNVTKLSLLSCRSNADTCPDYRCLEESITLEIGSGDESRRISVY